ncbi:hypothetical protein DVH24_009330 [Malus domestica]|uniref:Uncharacterized protein n=1 Tax=Malus domestica TaxID=3750 RepID=A0A498IQN4_MALDO|nr:hypothetical protein DVH24_009330 [Malus domestica]
MLDFVRLDFLPLRFVGEFLSVFSILLDLWHGVSPYHHQWKGFGSSLKSHRICFSFDQKRRHRQLVRRLGSTFDGGQRFRWYTLLLFVHFFV